MAPIPRWVVLKFGGTSVSTPDNWETIYREVAARVERGWRPLVVHSALSGISDQLERLLVAAPAGEADALVEAIEQRHLELAGELAVDGEGLLRDSFAELRRITAGIALVGEASYRLQARTLALGELMATRLGAAFLARRGLAVAWRDARELLQSEPRRHVGERARYLSATCGFAADVELQQSLAAHDAVIVTQGFIAREPGGATVLLGRGGSDISASYLAVRLEAAHVEIWTDVPGMFSADPRLVPGARLLRRLDYFEAQEIATSGAKVLHPACLPPLRRSGIPLQVRCTAAPGIDGTRISNDPGDSAPHVKVISIRSGLTLISMETMGMWHQAGFLADSFDCFKRHGLSVDLVSTSETNVTVSLDAAANELDTDGYAGLVESLGELCRVQVIESCAAISLVGRHIRGMLHELGPALQVFEEHRIHLVSQAANDLNFTFVVDDAQGPRLVQRLHELLIPAGPADPVFGATRNELMAGAPSVAPAMRDGVWWAKKRQRLLELAPPDRAVFVYDLATVTARAEALTSLTAVDRVFYAVKANAHAAVLRALLDAGLSFECVSPGEIARVLEACPGIERDLILFTPNFAAPAEYALGFDKAGQVTLDNLYPLEHWPDLFRGRELLVRIDPGHGQGHHRHVRTAGSHSKFGVPAAELDDLLSLADACGARIVGLHAHVGSGILQADNWQRTATLLGGLSARLPHVRVLNLGGGFGVPEKPAQQPLDLAALDASLQTVKAAYPALELWLEPGRFLVSEAGVLLARVTQTKGKGRVGYVGLNTGMNSLIRPALYGAWHDIVNLSRYGEPATELVNVVGPICESGDQLGSERLLPPSAEGDVFLIANAGAYGRVMGSSYNL
ncbi:MAG TPA: bifunctional aspartate kinase/diaminopimelate decarboxylase, partial [Gammaproteobacteria bacterium]|nr:bifunctional aspartate kinase/diaminopimelate decarboxylase [Gammaproteobacteria bacterium]